MPHCAYTHFAPLPSGSCSDGRRSEKELMEREERKEVYVCVIERAEREKEIERELA